MSSESLKATSKFTGAIWNPYSRGYQRVSGQPVDTSKVRKIVSDIRSGTRDRLEQLAKDVQSGDLTNMAEFALEFKDEIKNIYVASHILARGGIEEMDQSAWGMLGQSLKEQYGYIDNLVRDIEKVDDVSELGDGFLNRIELYSESAWGARGEFENVVRDRELKLGSLERLVFGNTKEHCDECLEDEAKGFQPPGLLADLGDRTCGPGCGCSLEFENQELDDLADAFGHIQIGVEGDPETEQPEFTLYPEKALKGGQGSGNFGHQGRPGERGGSGEGGGELTQSEKEAVTEMQHGLYNSAIGGYSVINNYLREGKVYSGQKEEDIKNFVGWIDSALNKSITSEDKEVYRGVRDSTAVLGSDKSQWLGKTFTDKGYTSTAETRTGSRQFADKLNREDIPVTFTIHVPAGSHGLNVESVTGQRAGLSKNEREFLLPRNSTFEVTSVRGSNVGLKLISGSRKSLKGGPGSGNFGHSGIPGQQGGSGPGGSEKATSIEDSKTGIPIEASVFHGSNSDFNELKVSQSETSEGIFLNDDWTVAGDYGKIIYAVDVKLNNPLVVDAEGKHWYEMSMERLTKQAKSEGRDGIVFKNIFDGKFSKVTQANNIVAFNPKSTKITGKIDSDTLAEIPLSE